MNSEMLSFAQFRRQCAASDSEVLFWDSLALFAIKQHLRTLMNSTNNADECADAAHLLGFIERGDEGGEAE